MHNQLAKVDSKDAEGGTYIRGSDEKLCFIENEKRKDEKDYIKQIKNEENGWDDNMEGEAIEAK